MKQNFSGKKKDPVPSRVAIIVGVIFMTLFSTSVAAGKVMVDEGWEFPVILSDGSIWEKPWYITIDDKKIALVDSKETAEKTVQKIIEKYREEDEKILDVEVMEKTSVEEMNLKNGDDPPDVLSEKEAEKKIMKGNKGKGHLTVVTVEEKIDEVSINFEEEYIPDTELYAGDTRVEREGKNGRKEVAKKVIKENGVTVDEEIVDEKVIEEPQEKIIRTGTKKVQKETVYLDGNSLSYDENAVYGKLETPVKGGTITSPFGQRWGKLHRGVDIALPQGSDIYAADSGKVYFAGECGTYGNIVKIDHGNGMQTYYAHCSKLLVNSGQTVKRGERIALVGSTGNSTGPHVHFEVIINEACTNPIVFIDF